MDDVACESEYCSSTYFRLGGDGYTYCGEGHQQTSRGPVIADDIEGVPQFGKKARRQDEEEEAIDTALSGKRGFDHYLLCLQLILWKQVHWLISVKSIRPELETIVRDLWALRLQMLQPRVGQDSEGDTDQQSQLFSSQSEGEHDEFTEQDRQSKRVKSLRTPQMVDSLSLCYIGILLLRLPVTIRDIYQWAGSGDLLYYQASKQLPVAMKKRMEARYISYLDSRGTLQASTLHQAVLDNLVAYNRSFGVVIPTINHTLVLYRWVHSLGLPLEVYSAVGRLATMLEMDFAYDIKIGREQRHAALRLAETKLMSLLIVATKLLFPMDDVKRYPRTPAELSALAMDWSLWSEARAHHRRAEASSERLDYAQAMQTTEEDVMNMTDTRLDEYMDWYQSVFTIDESPDADGTNQESEFRRAMFRFFPTKRPTDAGAGGESLRDQTANIASKHERLKRVQAALRPVRVKADGARTAEETVNRPGTNYKRYRNVNELAGYTRELYEEAAELCATELESLVRGVFVVERKLQQVEEAARKSSTGMSQADAMEE